MQLCYTHLALVSAHLMVGGAHRCALGEALWLGMFTKTWEGHVSFPTFTECPGPSLPLLPCRLHSQRQGARICRLVSHIRKTWKHRLYVVLATVPASASGQQRVRMGEPGGPIYQVETMAIEPRPQRCFAIPRSHCGAASDAIGLPIVFRSIEPGSQDPRRLSPSSTLFGARDRVPISPRSRSATVGWCWPLTGLGFVKTRQSAILLGSRVNCSNRRAGTHVAHRYSAPQKSLSSLSYLRMSNFKTLRPPSLSIVR